MGIRITAPGGGSMFTDPMAVDGVPVEQSRNLFCVPRLHPSVS